MQQCLQNAPFCCPHKHASTSKGGQAFHMQTSQSVPGLDNAHSTPLHVSRHVLSRVREADGLKALLIVWLQLGRPFGSKRERHDKSVTITCTLPGGQPSLLGLCGALHWELQDRLALPADPGHQRAHPRGTRLVSACLLLSSSSHWTSLCFALVRPWLLGLARPCNATVRTTWATSWTAWAGNRHCEPQAVCTRIRGSKAKANSLTLSTRCRQPFEESPLWNGHPIGALSPVPTLDRAPPASGQQPLGS